MCHETTKEERNPPLPGSGVLTSALRHTGRVLQGVAHSPLTEAGRAREGAQRWGTYMSLSMPPIRQYKGEFYKIHYDPAVPEGRCYNLLIPGHRQGDHPFRIPCSQFPITGMGRVGEVQPRGDQPSRLVPLHPVEDDLLRGGRARDEDPHG